MKARIQTPQVPRALRGQFTPYPDLQLTQGDVITFKRFRYLEPGLVSLLDANGSILEENHEVLVLGYKNDPVGCISLVLFPKTEPCDGRMYHNARLDLVIVPNGFREMGIGRTLIHLGLCYLLERCGATLHTISAQTEHPAVDRVLQNLEFPLIPVMQDTTLCRSLNLKSFDFPGFLHVIQEKTGESLKRLHTHLRQLHAHT